MPWFASVDDAVGPGANDIGVVAAPPLHPVRPGAAIEMVGALAAHQRVIAGTAVKPVVPVVANQGIGAAVAAEVVTEAGAADDLDIRESQPLRCTGVPVLVAEVDGGRIGIISPFDRIGAGTTVKDIPAQRRR